MEEEHRMPRPVATQPGEALLEHMRAVPAGGGGELAGQVGRSTDYLVAGDDPGARLEEARRLGVRIITPAEFHALLSPGDTLASRAKVRPPTAGS